jgi:2-dehydro-3-deoxygluconokinase
MNARERRAPDKTKAGKPAPRPPRVAAFGELLLRLNTLGHERFVQAGQFTARYTGGEANAAAALAQWGVETYAVSRVPAHELGQACVNFLRQYGVNTDHVLRGGDRLGILYVETGASQRPSKVIYDRAATGFRSLDPAELDWDAILAGKDWLHFTGTAPAVGENVRRALKDGLRAAKRHGLTVSLDVNYRSTLWGLKEARAVLGGLMEHVHVFLGAHHDAEALFGVKGEPPESAARMRERYGFRCVAYLVRQGESASANSLAGLLCDAGGCAASRRYQMQVVDRIGGGDAFTAGVIYGLLSGRRAQETVEFAAAASCLKHSIPGDMNLVSLDEVQRLLKEGESGRVRR